MINGSWWAEWGQADVITRVVNPITRTVITLSPVIEINNERDLSLFQDWVVDYCQTAWNLPERQDPQVIDASNWRDGLPAGI